MVALDSNTKVLLIEDEKTFGEAFRQLLSDNGFDVIWVLKGMDGIDKAKASKPHIIILDIILPDMDGWDVLTQLKQEPTTKNIPVVVNSNLYSPERELEFLHHGAVAYLSKANVNGAVLLKKIQEVLSQHQN